MNEKSGCIICGESLEYFSETVQMKCFICGNMSGVDVCCKGGHFVCDHCHSAGANKIIETFCAQTNLTDPIAMAEQLMKSPQVKMHGPEHHYLVPAVLITAFYNLKDEKESKLKKLKLARQRSEKIPGGFCGSHGNCGAGVGTGIFFSLITDTTPLSGKTWQLSNLLTGNCLVRIANMGGPRCCKRDSFTAIREAVDFVGKHLGIQIPAKENISCSFHSLNKECLEENCIYYPV